MLSRGSVEMNVVEVMTSPVHACGWHDTLARVAQIMWDHDCGCVPVVNTQGDPVAMITDRDVCMAAYTQGKTLSEIPVMTAASHHFYSVRPGDSVEAALHLMRTHRIRRVPVIDSGGNMIGIVSLRDIATAQRATKDAMEMADSELFASAFSEICRPHHAH